MTTMTRALATLDFAISPEVALQRWEAFHSFVREQMIDGIDYGVIPGTDKPTLLKPGAEKLNNLYGLAPEQAVTERVQDWQGGFFFDLTGDYTVSFANAALAGMVNLVVVGSLWLHLRRRQGALVAAVTPT